MNIDLEQLKALQELTQPKHDAFEGLRKNWVFLSAIALIGFWVVQNVFDIKTINTTQTSDIAENRTAIIDLQNSIDDNRDTNVEIIRRLDALQKDVEVISNSTKAN